MLGHEVRSQHDFRHFNQLTFHSLAYCELFLCITAVVTRLIDRIELINPNVEDVRFYHDYFMPASKNWRQGVKAYVNDASGEEASNCH